MPIEPAEQFRKAAKIRPLARVEQAEQDLAGHVFVSVFGEATGDDGIVMRPDGAVVVRKRIVTNLSGSDGADTPTAEGIGTHQRLRDPASAIGATDAGIQAMARVRCSHSTLLFVSVESQRIGGQSVAPKSLFKANTQLFRFRFQGPGLLAVAQHAAEARGRTFGGIHVTLDFT